MRQMVICNHQPYHYLALLFMIEFEEEDAIVEEVKLNKEVISLLYTVLA